MAEVAIISEASDAAVAQALHVRLEDALERPGPVAIAVAGGTTPFPILTRLAEMPLDWTRIAVWPTDDRIVPEGDPASNVGRLRALLEPLGAKVVALREGAIPPPFAFTWLGMGADGHIASLFPGDDPEGGTGNAIRRVVPDPLPPEAPYPRLTMTIPALLDTQEVIFVIRGGDKWGVFEQAMAGAHDLPVARLLKAVTQPVTCFD